jgi:hypothetical protein
MIRRLLLPLLLALPAVAQTSGLSGTWTLAEAPDLPKVIEAATASMNFITRPIARSRLAKTNTAYRTLRIDLDASEVTIQPDQRIAQRMPADGQPVVWTREDGETFLLTVRRDKDDLVQTFKASDGQRTNVYHLDPASRTLTLAVTVTSPRLPQPLTYTLVYR